MGLGEPLVFALGRWRSPWPVAAVAGAFLGGAREFPIRSIRAERG